MAFHSAEVIGSIHIIHQFEYANAAARTGATLASTDIGKVARQLDDDSFWVLQNHSPLTWASITGGAAAAGTVDTEVLSFAYNDSSPVDFGSIVNGDQIIEAQLFIDTAFDDVAATLQLGITGTPDNLFSTANSDPAVAAAYHNGEGFLATGSDQFRLQINPGTSTQGAGRVVIRIRRA